MPMRRPRLLACLPLLFAALALTLALPARAAIDFVAATSNDNNGTSLTLAVPPGALANDVLVATIVSRGNGSVSASGWTQATVATDGSTARMTVLYRVRQAGDPASVTVSLSNGNRLAGTLAAFRDVDTASPIAAAQASVAGGATSTITATGTNVPVNNAVIVASFAQANGNVTLTPGTGLTLGAVAATRAGPNGASMAFGYAVQPAAGASGNRTASSDRAERSLATLIALRPGAFDSVALGPFNAYESNTAVNAVSGVLRTKVVGQPFTVDVVTLSADRSNYGYYASVPAMSNFRVELLDASNNGGVMDATTGCRSSWIVTATLSTTFSMGPGDNGRKAFTATAGVGLRQARLRFSWQPNGATPATVGCSNDAFAVRPAAFADVQARDGDASSAGTTRLLDNTSATSGVVHRAGRPFTLQGRAVGADGATVTAYDGTPNTTVTCLQPSGCTAGVVLGTTAANAGSFSTTKTYNEAGVIALSLSDTAFAQIDASDPGSTLAERTIATAAPITVGRFVPDSYSVTPNTPDFAAGCSAGNVTFVGQPFAFGTQPTAVATPLNSDGQPLANARPRLTAAMVTVEVTATGAPTALQGTVGTVSVSNAATSFISVGTSNFNFLRNATPSASYTPAFMLRVRVDDTTETNAGAPLTLSGEGSTAVSFAGGHLMQYGRLALRPAYGDARQDLVLPLELQRFNGTGWVPLTTAASCIGVTPPQLAYTGARGSLATNGAFNCASSVASVTPAGGRWAVRLPRPSLATGVAEGAMNVHVNTLTAATGQVCGSGLPTAATSTLASPWLAQPDGSNPAARVQWGRSRGEFVQVRERFN
jgi:MSHA biogenesis protein MshQ